METAIIGLTVIVVFLIMTTLYLASKSMPASTAPVTVIEKEVDYYPSYYPSYYPPRHDHWGYDRWGYGRGVGNVHRNHGTARMHH
jgi:hypothetical protein